MAESENGTPSAKQETVAAESPTPSIAPIPVTKISLAVPPAERHPFAAMWNWIKNGTSSTDWLIVILTAVIAGTSYLQWREIRSGSTDTHLLAQAADTQAKKMGNMSDAADKIRDAAQGMVTQEQRLADNAKQSLDANNKQSGAVLGQTISASRLDQRAWIGIETSVVAQFDETKPLKISLTYFNSGKSPARKVRSSGGYRLTRDSIDGPLPEDVRNLVLALKPATAIPPQGRYMVTVPNDDSKNPLRNEFAALKSRIAHVYFFGEIQYEDISGSTHTTTFCTYLSDPEAKTMAFCPDFNDMN